MQIGFKSVSQGLVHVDVFADEVDGIDSDVVDLIMKQILEVGGGEDVSPLQKILLESSLERARALGFQRDIGLRKWRCGEGFFEARLFESAGIGETKARSREQFGTA